MICVLFIYPSLYSLSSLSSLCSPSIAWFFWHLSIFFFRTLVSHVDNAVSFGDCWFHTSGYNSVNTKCLNLIMFFGDSFQGICWQSHSTEWIERPKIFFWELPKLFHSLWLKAEKDGSKLRIVLETLYLLHYYLVFKHFKSKPSSWFSYLCFHPYVLNWLKKKFSSKTRIHKVTETWVTQCPEEINIFPAVKIYPS